MSGGPPKSIPSTCEEPEVIALAAGGTRMGLRQLSRRALRAGRQTTRWIRVHRSIGAAPVASGRHGGLPTLTESTGRSVCLAVCGLGLIDGRVSCAALRAARCAPRQCGFGVRSPCRGSFRTTDGDARTISGRCSSSARFLRAASRRSAHESSASPRSEYGTSVAYRRRYVSWVLCGRACSADPCLRAPARHFVTRDRLCVAAYSLRASFLVASRFCAHPRRGCAAIRQGAAAQPVPLCNARRATRLLWRCGPSSALSLPCARLWREGIARVTHRLSMGR
jgi:hypothetical protein